MEKTSCNIPTPEELRNYIKESVISVTGTYEQSASVLMVDDSTIGTLGNFSASIGKAKSKKTFNVSAIAAAALKNGTVLHYRACFPDGKRKILYVDTEQGKNHCQIVLNRILRLAGLPKDCDADNLTMLALRKYSPEVRLAITEEAIGMIPDLGLVIIDGIRDFIHDINSPGESTDVISKFMQWTDDRQIHIHTVLHQNKNDEHARGHVGTELNNKAETVMQIEPDKDDKSISVVEVIHSRDREFEPFAFRVNDDSLPELVESYQPQKRQPGRPPKEPFNPYKEIPEDTHRSALNAAFEDGNIGGYNGYLERLKEGYGRLGIKLGYNKTVELAKFLCNKRMVVKKWIAHSEGFAKGEIHINECATEVLNSEKAVSILPIGITHVEGEFEKDDIVRIMDFQGNQVGVGKVNCDSKQVQEAIGKHGKKPVVHYDYLYIE